MFEFHAIFLYFDFLILINQPWYLATFAVAEQLYDALQVWSTAGSLNVTSLSLPFFQLFDSAVTVGTYASTSAEYTKLTTGIKTFADGFILVNAKYTPSNGGLAEQYSRSSGSPVSATDLTWSYASAITAFEARSGANAAFPGWGAAGLTVPTACQRSGGGGGGSSGTVAVTFNVQATTVWGGESQSEYSILGFFIDDKLQRTSISLVPWMRFRIGRLITP